MKNLIFSVLILTTNIYVKAQTKLSLMQGIWDNITSVMYDENSRGFTIVSGNKALNFVYIDNQFDINFPLSESIKGFLNYNPVESGVLKVSELKSDGEFYVTVNTEYIKEGGVVEYPHFLVPDYFECDGDLLSINGGKLIEYEKVNLLPEFALKLLYKRGEKDKRNYIQDYLHVNVTEINSDCEIYTEPGKISGQTLMKGDIVIVSENKDEWLKIILKDTDTGWIKKMNVIINK